MNDQIQMIQMKMNKKFINNKENKNTRKLDQANKESQLMTYLTRHLLQRLLERLPTEAAAKSSTKQWSTCLSLIRTNRVKERILLIHFSL